MNIRAIVTYDGTEYYGFQKTKLRPSIEESLEKALFTVLQKNTNIQGASRTDRGVHAKGQVINFFIDKPLCLDKLQNSLNGVLPHTIRILLLQRVPAHFHPSLDSLKKTYSYSICNQEEMLPHYRNTTWHYAYKKIDLILLQQGANLLIGTHDFSAFSSKKSENPICTIEKIYIEEPNSYLIKIFITGDRFLYKMARTLIGTLVHISSKQLPLTEVKNLFTHKLRKKAGVTAPAHGLCLEKVYYDPQFP